MDNNIHNSYLSIEEEIQYLFPATQNQIVFSKSKKYLKVFCCIFSTMSYMSESPQVYAYKQPEVLTSLDRHQPLYNQSVLNSKGSFNPFPQEKQQAFYPSPPLNRYGESQIEAVFAPIAPQSNDPSNRINQGITNGTIQPRGTQGYQQLQRIPEYGINQNNLGIVEGSQAPRSTARFDSYLATNQQSYKYNIFSLVDEPWNRCTRGQSCTTSAGNECIADKNFSTLGSERQSL